MSANNFNINGLIDEQVVLARANHGENTLKYKQDNTIIDAIKKLAKEPMIILLFAASLIYLVSGKIGDAIFLASAIVLVSIISLYQDSRSRNAVQNHRLDGSSC